MTITPQHAAASWKQTFGRRVLSSDYVIVADRLPLLHKKLLNERNMNVYYEDLLTMVENACILLNPRMPHDLVNDLGVYFILVMVFAFHFVCDSSLDAWYILFSDLFVTRNDKMFEARKLFVCITPSGDVGLENPKWRKRKRRDDF